MTLLALLAAGDAWTGPGLPAPEQDPPAAVATVAPYNAPAPCVIPTPDSTGSTIHPTVVDMGARWNGWRYWLADTPYAGSNDALENPCIWVSHDCQTWQVPPGGSNPIYPTPPIGHWADTDLIWDPERALLVMTFNEGGGTLYQATSSDGVTWPLLADAGVHPKEALFPDVGLMLAPSLVRVDAFLWRLYVSTGYMVEGPTSTGPWGPPVPTPGLAGWHQHVIYDDHRFYAISSGGGAYTSPDGKTWVSRGSVLPARLGWEAGGTIYRSSMRRYDATTFHVFYSVTPGTGSADPNNPYVGYTRIPRSMWD